jgi:hypothetical protein
MIDFCDVMFVQVKKEVLAKLGLTVKPGMKS